LSVERQVIGVFRYEHIGDERLGRPSVFFAAAAWAGFGLRFDDDLFAQMCREVAATGTSPDTAITARACARTGVEACIIYALVQDTFTMSAVRERVRGAG